MLHIVALVLSLLSLLAGFLHYIKLGYSRLDASALLYLAKLGAGAGAPLLALLGLVAALLGLLGHAPLAVAAGLSGAFLSVYYVRRLTAARGGAEGALNITGHVPPATAARLLPARWVGWLPPGPRPRVEKDVPFWTPPGALRPLLCDVWRPAEAVPYSGTMVLYFHSGGWQNLDKDRYTRPFFRRLCAQGHVVMDVAYRLCHEADLRAMVGDVKRAIVWAKEHARCCGTRRAEIVLCGASAGAHLALLAAYTPSHPELDPGDLFGADTSVRGVISFYGLPTLSWLGLRPSRPSSPAFVALARRFGLISPHKHLDWPDVMRHLLGGLPNEVPEAAALYSPIQHVGPHCPPTLIIHGRHDRVVPVQDARDLYAALRSAGAPVVYLELPFVEHAFDLVALRISPPAQAALYELERFVALLADGAWVTKSIQPKDHRSLRARSTDNGSTLRSRMW
ncbi:MAG: alpha/beta hydrolase [Anaerolineae bacterium]